MRNFICTFMALLIFNTAFSQNNKGNSVDSPTNVLDSVLVKSYLKKIYFTKSSTAGIRLSLPLIETPQSIQVINHEIIKDQQAQNLNDLTKNLTGVINNNSYTSYTMRGFTNYYPNSFIIFDGFMGNMYQWSQMVQLYNIDKVEMIAGPASALYSVGTPGGVMNMVTKKPLDEKQYSFTITTGSWNLFDVSADLGGAIDKHKKLLYRFNIGYNTANSFRPYQFNRNLLIAPSLVYNFSDKTNISLDLVNNDNHTRFAYDRGGLVFMNPDSTYNFNRALSSFVHNSPSDFGHINSNSITLKFNHAFTSNFRLTYLSRFVNNHFDMGEHYGTMYGDHYLTHLDTLERRYDKWLYTPYNLQNSIFTTFDFGKSNFKNSLITGIDYQLYGATKNQYIDDVAAPISISNPDYSKDDFTKYPVPDQYENDRQDTKQLGLYLQDLISIKEKFKLLLSGRYEHFLWINKPLSSANWSQTNDSSVANVFLPRIGLVYTLDKSNTLYGSYCESFNPQYDNTRGSGGPFPPQKGKQIELGFKAQIVEGKLFTTLALYHIDYINVLKSDPTDPSGKKQIAVPGLSSRGIELTAQGNLGDFNIIGGYAYNRVVFSANSPLGVKGGRYDNAANHVANIWIKYVLPNKSNSNKWSISFGGKYIGDRVGSGFNQHFLMPAYALFDAAIGYSMQDFSFDLIGNNLFNQKYVLGAYYSDLQVPMGTPLNWKFSIRYSIK